MSKAETLKQLASAYAESRAENVQKQIEQIEQLQASIAQLQASIAQLQASIAQINEAKTQIVKETAERLEPLAQALAALTDDTQEAIEETTKAIKKEREAALEQIAKALKAQQHILSQTKASIENFEETANGFRLRFAMIIAAVAIVSSILTSASFFLLKPVHVETPALAINSRAIVEMLMPEIEKWKQSKNR